MRGVERNLNLLFTCRSMHCRSKLILRWEKRFQFFEICHLDLSLFLKYIPNWKFRWCLLYLLLFFFCACIFFYFFIQALCWLIFFPVWQVLHNMSMWTAKEKSLNYDQAKAEAARAQKDIKMVKQFIQTTVFQFIEYVITTLVKWTDRFLNILWLKWTLLAIFFSVALI